MSLTIRDIKVRPSKQKAIAVYEQLIADMMEEERTGIHVSDICSPLKSYWRKLDPKPPSLEEVGFWLAGRAHHYFLVKALTGVADSEEDSLTDKQTGIVYSPDLLKMRGEFKTSRRWAIPQTEKEGLDTLASYFEQCWFYASMVWTEKWTLFILFLTPNDEETGRKIPKLTAYDLIFTEQQLLEGKREAKRRKTALTAALKKKDPSALPLCPPYFCHKVYKGKHFSLCQHFNKCKPPGRWNRDFPARLPKTVQGV